MRWRFRAVWLALVLAAPSVALANCADYGRTAAAQQQENVTLGCGFSGLRWHDNAGAHAGYCGLAGEAAANGELALRERDLASCRAAVGADAPAIPEDCRKSDVAEGKGATRQDAMRAARDKLGRTRAEMMNAGLTSCLYNDLGCTGANGDHTCFLSIGCCPR